MKLELEHGKMVRTDDSECLRVSAEIKCTYTCDTLLVFVKEIYHFPCISAVLWPLQSIAWTPYKTHEIEWCIHIYAYILHVAG